MSTENNVAEPAEQELQSPEESSNEGAFDRYFSDQQNEETSDELADEIPGDEVDEADDPIDGEESGDEETSSESPDENQEAAQSQAEGTSVAMQQLARQEGIPEPFIQLARDDQQLSEIVQLANGYQRDESPQAPEPEEYKVELPQEEYGDEDPIRKELARFSNHQAQQIKELKGFMETMGKELKQLQTSAESTQRESEQQFIESFDAGLDKLNSDILGTAEKWNDTHNEIRQAVWSQAMKLRKNGDRSTPDELGQKAAKQLFPGLFDNQQSYRQQPGQKQARKRLGTSQAAKRTEREPTRKENFFARVDQILSKNGVG